MAPFSPIRYAKVKISPRVTRTIQVLSERDGMIFGMRVTDSGEKWEHEDATSISTEMVVCHTKDVVRELRLNLHYDELEDVGEGGMGL